MRSYDMLDSDWSYFNHLTCDNFLPCPFCGDQKAFLIADYTRKRLFGPHDPHFPLTFYVECGSCFARSGSDLDPYAAVEKWGKRVPLPKSDSQLH